MDSRENGEAERARPYSDSADLDWGLGPLSK
jgi:hypothetical protein